MTSLKFNFFGTVLNKWITNTTKKDLDVICVVYGREGVGKSTLAIVLADHLMKKQGKKLDVRKNIHYTVDDFQNAIFNGSPGDVHIIDESILFAFSREAMAKDNKRLVKILATCRSQNQIILFCIPNIHTLDSYLREHRTVCGLQVTSRGKFRVWPKRALTLIAQRKPHRMRQKLYETFNSVQKICGIDTWNEYIAHKHEKVKQETGEQDKSNKHMEALHDENKYVRAIQITRKYDVSGDWLIRHARMGKLDAIVLPSGDRRYDLRSFHKLIGVKPGSD